MSQRWLWLGVLLCCLTAVTLVHVPSRINSSSRHESSVQSSPSTTEGLADAPESDLHPARSNYAAELLGAHDEVRPPVEGKPSRPEQTAQDQTSPEQEAARPPVQTAAPRQQNAASAQEAERQAEVWSYPPLLQQNAATNFVRAMEKLASAKSESDRYLALGESAKLAFIFGKTEDARSYATELLSLDEKFKGEPWRNGGAVHDGNLILGRIAAQEGWIEQAKQYLLDAGKSTGSPALGSFGPNMSLARDLLQKGERDTVLAYFDLCGKFWTLGNERLALWVEVVKAGRTPDFGANLLY